MGSEEDGGQCKTLSQALQREMSGKSAGMLDCVMGRVKGSLRAVRLVEKGGLRTGAGVSYTGTIWNCKV